MEESINQKNKSALEKIAPYILVVGVIILGYFAFLKFKVVSTDTNVLPVANTGNVQIDVDTNFLTSNAFTELKFIPDSNVFNEVTGDIPKGRDDPFAPIK
ncbi:MAG TPA: hypothetical protein PLD14_00470 [Candidatus Pacearchaeota archaeon]|nr:hypothetical protein [Candidatus Pacearchaeota archaeon]HPR79689.1 hypothetical protein [Candidatus Pacearchaeota archaeon]